MTLSALSSQDVTGNSKHLETTAHIIVTGHSGLLPMESTLLCRGLKFPQVLSLFLGFSYIWKSNTSQISLRVDRSETSHAKNL